MRPISVTSCVAKVVKRMALKRLQRLFDVTGQMPMTKDGFRERIGTHDVLLQPHELVSRALALDPRDAFDNLTHASILHNLKKTGFGEKIFKYTKDFLGNHT